MDININETFTAILPIAESQNTDSVTYVIYKSSGAVFASGNAIFVAGINWKVIFIPDVEDIFIVEVNDSRLDVKYSQSFRCVRNSTAMSFKNQMNDDAALICLNSSEFAEVISYIPKGAAAKIINALIDRKRLNPAGEVTGHLLLNQIEIFIANDAINGVISVNKGADTVVLKERVGGSDATYLVNDIINQDPGMWHLLLQK